MRETNEQSGARGLWAVWPLRLMVLLPVLIAIDIACQMAPRLFGNHVPAGWRAVVALGDALVTVVVVALSYRLAVRWTERRDATELGRRGLSGAPQGVVIGVSLFSAVYLVLWLLHVATFAGFATTSGLVFTFAASLAAAVTEEIIFRGVVFRIAEEGMGTWAALVSSGGLFGLIHGLNPGATVVSTLAIALEAGVLLAAAYALTRSLWLPIGLHFGWNFTEGGIFGAAVSGGKAHGLFEAPISGPALLSGGAFGPEASVVAVVLCLLVAVAMIALAIPRGAWQPFRLVWKTP